MYQNNFYKTFEDLIQYMIKCGFKEMGIEDIGKKRKDVIKIDNIDGYSEKILKGAFRFSAFTFEERYKIFREQNRPESVLEHLIDLGYIYKKQRGIEIKDYEEELSETIESLEKKYSKKKVDALKKRLKID
jgi:hypothetical protein